MRRERNRRAGELATGVALPMMPNLAALDEFRGERRDHRVTALRATNRGPKGADGGELRPVFMKLHVTASLLSPHSMNPWVAAYRGKYETV